MIFEVKITEAMKQRAYERANSMGKLTNSITSGQGNMAGFLGEEVANEIIGGTISNTYDYDIIQHSFTPQGVLLAESFNITWDVKTKRCTSPPKDYYDCSIASYNTKQKCDRYVFVRIECKGEEYTRAWVLGWYDKDAYFKNARKLTKGDFDGDNGFIVKADCHNLQISQLNSFERDEHGNYKVV